VTPFFPADHPAVYVDVDGRPDPAHAWDPARPTALLPGSFNPIHAGHRALAETAAELLGVPVVFELSVANVDKPPLDEAEVRARLAQFTDREPVWLTRAPIFALKAALFPGAVFVVGADTALRIVDSRYYEHDPAQMHRALGRLGEQGCRFLVACRVDGAGLCVELADIEVPPAYRPLFRAIPADLFRLDVSSTQIRRLSGA
jgi:cytidyltransferase-like protein